MAGQQAYIVFRRTSEDGEDALLGSTRKVAILLGKDIFQGELSLTEEDITLRDVVKMMGYLKHMRQSIPFDCNLDELSPTSSVSRISRNSTTQRASWRMRSSIRRISGRSSRIIFLEDLSKTIRTNSRTLSCRQRKRYLNGIELICLKATWERSCLMLSTSRDVLLRHGGSWGRGAALIDSRFPDIGKRGCFCSSRTKITRYSAN